jgi:hypothetical protein
LDLKYAALPSLSSRSAQFAAVEAGKVKKFVLKIQPQMVRLRNEKMHMQPLASLFKPDIRRSKIGPHIWTSNF